ncbi:MAG TPA: hypothetical protein VF170_16925, partial [Planctomycetaceae bacterium]
AIYGVFPPAFGPIATPVDPFRPEARGLLQQVERTLVTQTPPTYQSDHLKRLVRKLSVNHVAAAQGGRYILRPVMPHPLPGGASPGLSNDPIPVPALNDPQKNPLTPGATGPSGRPFFGVSDQVLAANGLTTNAIANPNVLTAVGFVTPGGQPWPEAAQEWYARRDRQNLARDIYTLLYLLSDPDATPTTNPVLTPNDLSRLVYSEAQLAEMAQFAVNLVDAMDPDDTITAFVYDKDLADGYTPLDDAHGSLDPSGPNPVPYNAVTGRYEDPVRGIVFGVEAQKLAIGEALAVFAHRYEQGGVPGDHYATEWNDQFHNDFAYVELQNMTPAAVPLNGGWSIVCESDFAPATTGVAVPRTLTI